MVDNSMTRAVPEIYNSEFSKSTTFRLVHFLQVMLGSTSFKVTQFYNRSHYQRFINAMS